MSSPGPSQGAPPAWPMYRAMVGIGLACSLLIVSVFLGTRPVIERNRAEALARAVFSVLPQARASATFRLGADERFELLGEGETAERVAHAGYDDAGRLVGLAVEAEGQGYQDVIRILYGYSPHDEAIVGISVLESRETPGLGDRIETDPAFLANFQRLDVRLSGDGARIVHPIEAVKHGTKESPWQVDGITGATISSVAIAGILRRSSKFWVPLLRHRAGDFERR